MIFEDDYSAFKMSFFAPFNRFVLDAASTMWKVAHSFVYEHKMDYYNI